MRNGFENRVVRLHAVAASAAFLALNAYAGPVLAFSFGAGALLAALSFLALVWTAYLIIPEKGSRPVSGGKKALIALAYVAKIALFVIAFVYLSRWGASHVVSFLCGFSVLLPALLLAGARREAVDALPRGEAPPADPASEKVTK